MDDLAGYGEVVVLYVIVVEKPDVFDYSFFFEFYWDAVFEVVEDFFGVFASAGSEF